MNCGSALTGCRTARVIDAGIVDPRVLERYRKEARRRKIGYQTLINEVLAQHVGKDVA
jgi:predicted DNA binding CopG/RHH family protein